MNPPMVRKYLDFEVIKESWNKYSLQDGTKFKVRTILESVWSEQEKGMIKHNVTVTNIHVWLCDSTVQGEPSTKQRTPKQLEESIEVQSCPYTTIQYEPSEYVLDDGSRIVLHDTLVNIARTSLFNNVGDRIYIIKSTGQMSVEPAQK